MQETKTQRETMPRPPEAKPPCPQEPCRPAGSTDAQPVSPESIFESLAEAWDRDPERWDGLE